MPFHPGQYLGRPLADALDDLARRDAAEVWADFEGQVELYSAATPAAEAVASRPASLLTTVTGDTDLPADHPDVDVPGVVLESLLGGGGQGWVYAARVQATGCVVAVKVLRGEYVTAGGWAAREATICARVRHRNILRVFRAEPAGAFWVVIMELVQGGELDAGGLRPEQCKPCFGQVGDALRTLAESRIVHRDVKPSNILLRRQDASPVLVDFGLAVDLSASDDEPVRLSGTPLFLPPEAFLDAAAEPSWDAYSLGVTAAMVLTGSVGDYRNLNALRSAKLKGDFDRQVERSLEQVSDAALREWIGDLISREPGRRRNALEAAGMWLAA